MTDMRKDIEAILGECVGEDEILSRKYRSSKNRVISNLVDMLEIVEKPYNKALHDIRTRIPETARKVLERVREEVEKNLCPIEHKTYSEGDQIMVYHEGWNDGINASIASLAGEDEGDNGKEV